MLLRPCDYQVVYNLVAHCYRQLTIYTIRNNLLPTSQKLRARKQLRKISCKLNFRLAKFKLSAQRITVASLHITRSFRYMPGRFATYYTVVSLHITRSFRYMPGRFATCMKAGFPTYKYSSIINMRGCEACKAQLKSMLNLANYHVSHSNLIPTYKALNPNLKP